MKKFLKISIASFAAFILFVKNSHAQNPTAITDSFKFVPLKPVPYQLPVLSSVNKPDPGIPVPIDPKKNAAPKIEIPENRKPPAGVQLSTDPPAIKDNHANKNYSKSAKESLKIVKP